MSLFSFRFILDGTGFKVAEAFVGIGEDMGWRRGFRIGLDINGSNAGADWWIASDGDTGIGLVMSTTSISD